MSRSRSPLVAALVAASLLAALGRSGHADQEPDARDLMTRSDARTKAHSERTTYELDLLDASGKVEQKRTLEVFYKRFADREVTLQKFLAPPVLEDSGMMIVDTGEPVDDIWMYLPATRRLRRISGAEKSNWYMGTQFTYEDFEDYNLPAYAFSLERKAPCEEGEQCWVVAAVPSAASEKKASGYGKKLYWIETESLYPVRIDYYDRQDHEVKSLTTSGLERIGDYTRPTTMVMHDLRSGRSTRIRALKRQIDRPLDDYLVSQRYLRKD